MFQQYQGGIVPVQGISESGANIGRMAGSGIADMGKSLAEGIQAYHENTAKWDMVSGEADALASQVSNTQKLFLSHPAYAPLAEALSPYVDQLSGVKSQSLPKALGTLNSVKAAYQGTMQQFPVYEAIRKEREYGAFEEGANDPNNTTKVRIVPVGTAPKELIWDYRLPVEKNMLEASKYYDKYQAINPSVKLQEKSEWVKSWLRNLPTQIANDTSVNKQVRDKAIELVNTTVTSNFGNFYDPTYWLEQSGIAERSHPNFPTPAAINRMARQPQAQAPLGVASAPSLSPVAPTRAPNTEWQDVPIPVPTGAPASASAPVTQEVITPPIPVAPTEPRVSAPTPEYTGRATAPTAPVIPAPVAPARTAPVAPAPVAREVITPPVPAKSTEPKVSPPTPQYSDKAQPAKTPVRSVEDYAKELGVDEYYVKEQAKEYKMSVPDFYNSIKRDAESNGVSPKEWLKSINTPAVDEEPATSESTTAPEGLPAPERKFVNPNSAEGQRARIQRRIEQGAYAGSDGNLKYNLQRGDTVVGLARRFNMSSQKMEEYFKASGIDRNKSNVGDSIIFGPSTIEGQITQEEAEGASGDTSTLESPTYTPSAPLESPTYTPSTPLGKKEITPIGSEVIDPVKDEANRIASGMGTDDWAKVKVSRSHLRSQNNEAFGKYNGYKDSLNWLRTMRDSVADGKSTEIDFGPYGQWEKLHPDGALAIEVGFDAATILSSALKINKLQMGAKALSAADKSAEIATKAEKAYEVIKKAQTLKAEKLAKGPKQIEQMVGKVGEELLKRRKLADAAEEAKLFEDALGKAGVTVNAEVRAKIAKMGTDVYKQAGKGAFWTAVFEGMYGVNNEIPYSARSEPETRAYLDTTMDGIRKLRTGYTPFGFGSGEGLFGLNETIGTYNPLTSKEQIEMVKYLDEKIQQGEQEHDKYKTQYKSTFADLSNNKRLLSRYADISSGSPNANDVDTAYKASAPLASGSSIIGSKSFVTENTTEEKRGLLKSFMQKRLGYIPSGFDSMFNTQFPEATLKMQETPYGVMYHSNGEWKPMPSQKGNSMSFADVAKEKSVTFGEPLANGTFKPTEFIKGSGIKLGGIGAFGSAESAMEFRKNFPKLLVAKRIANELKDLNEVTGRSFSPEKWGTAAAKVNQLITQMRITLIGVGSVSDKEQELMQELVQDPTKFFSLQSTTRAKYNAMIQGIEESIVNMPQTVGLTVEMDADKAGSMQAARRAYQEFNGWNNLPESERAKIKESLNK